MQTRAQSLAESLCNIAVGYTINLLANLVVLPAFGVPVTIRQASSIGLAFTAISLARSYALRRAFNARHK